MSNDIKVLAANVLERAIFADRTLFVEIEYKQRAASGKMNWKERIKRIYKACCITQGELADMLGIHRSAIADYELG